MYKWCYASEIAPKEMKYQRECKKANKAPREKVRKMHHNNVVEKLIKMQKHQ